jgi:glutathione S-transferase
MATSASQTRKIIIFADLISQPSRAVLAFAKLAKIPHEARIIRLGKDEHKTLDIIKDFPIQQVPFMDDAGIQLIESHTIMRYLSQSRKVPDHFYPKDIVARAKVDMYLDWHHSNTRQASAFIEAISFKIPRKIPLGFDIEARRVKVEQAFKLLDTFWLSKGNFINGNKEMSIADISAFSEMAQTALIGLDTKRYVNIQRWMKKMLENPEISEVHQTVLDIGKKKNPGFSLLREV